jgi:hypothetical protein
MNPDSGRMYQAVGSGDSCDAWYEEEAESDEED